MFEVGGNAANNAFQLEPATLSWTKMLPYYSGTLERNVKFSLIIEKTSIETLDIVFRISAVHQPYFP